MKKKYVFIGDTDSINIELICKSHHKIKHHVKYIIICNLRDLKKYMNRISSNLKINEIVDPINFYNYKINYLNVFDIEHTHKNKCDNLLKQIKISNYLASKTKFDLITMPVNKSVFKKRVNFTGMTEYLGKINKKKTIMLMHGEQFSIIPLTTHINLSSINKSLKKDKLISKLDNILTQINKKIYDLKIKKIKMLCYNPHCSENKTIGSEDHLIKKCILHFKKKIIGPISADSAFNLISPKTLYLSMYHDQALIPFKILNKKSINLTLGLEFRRISPAHGTAVDIKFSNMANTTSYIECMKF